MNKYQSKLPADKTLCVYDGDSLIFSSAGKWLHPIFELEAFMETWNGSKENLCAHDSAIGKAAVVLLIRLGIKNIHADLGSELAENFVNAYNEKNGTSIHFTIENKVERIKCATEEELALLTDSEQMYQLIRKRAVKD